MENIAKHFMVSECDGHMYDTRVDGWYKRPPLRHEYAVIKRDVDGDSVALRAAIRTKYAWPGGYDLFGIASDGGTLCCDCMRREYYRIAYSRRYRIDDDWRIVAIDSAANYEGPICCDHCGKGIVEGGEA